MLTGEPEPLHKTHITQNNQNHGPVPFVVKDSLVENGEGQAIVAAVGTMTRSGKA